MSRANRVSGRPMTSSSTRQPKVTMEKRSPGHLRCSKTESSCRIILRFRGNPPPPLPSPEFLRQVRWFCRTTAIQCGLGISGFGHFDKSAQACYFDVFVAGGGTLAVVAAFPGDRFKVGVPVLFNGPEFDGKFDDVVPKFKTAALVDALGVTAGGGVMIGLALDFFESCSWRFLVV